MSGRDLAGLVVAPARGANDIAFMMSLAGEFVRVAGNALYSNAELEAFQYRFMTERLREPASPERLTLIAHADSHRAGFIHARPGVDEITGERSLYVALLVVHPKWRGHGIARRLMDASNAFARQEGYAGLHLDVFAANEPAQRFYRAMGYVPDSVRMVRRLTSRVRDEQRRSFRP